ncbi:hypothetical protein Glove_139g33 [Diversispora epigaea]|uniref:ATPase domain-containing protein n=1 Tax=Diversispora epigaea TaxID=1348612 RepID=A0A397J225_9GLOM|nr:hypothetical protein Glove_139g33 [Diversispora epigaea]
MSFSNIIQHFRRRILQPRPLPPLSQVLLIQPSPPLLKRSCVNSSSLLLPSSQLTSRFSPKKYIKAFIIFSILFGTSLILYEDSPSRRVNKAVQKGTQPKLNISSDEYYSRPQVLEPLKKIFTPHECSRSCYIIYGNEDIGKSTLIKMASREVGQGVIYVDIPLPFNNYYFGIEFKKAMNIDSLNSDGYKEEWKVALSAFERAAKVYKAKYGRPLVIIYDNVDRLIPRNTDILDILQSSVTESGNKGNYIAVFVCSGYSVTQRMSSRGHWTDIDYFEIGDLTEEESIDYLNQKNIREEEARKIYELVGGYILDLKKAAHDLFSGQSFEDIKKEFKFKVELKFRNARLLPGYGYYEVGRNIINILLSSGELCASELWKSLNHSERDKLMGKNVFKYNPETHKITFRSKSVESYERENSNLFIKKRLFSSHT